MRIHLKISSDGSVVPFDHQKQLTGTIHKWIGKENIEHGNISLYSFSTLTGGEKSIKGKGLVFDENSSFFISAYDSILIKSIIKSVQSDSTMFNGLKVSEIVIQENPDFSDTDYFWVASPVLIKRKVEEGRVKHYVYEEFETASFLAETLRTKMNKVGMEDDTLDIHFDQTYPKAKCRVVHYDGIKNKANICPVIIKGKPETKVFAWNVGIGNSTGIGLGAIK